MFFKKAIQAIRRGLQKTADAFGARVRTILHGRALSDAVIDEIETALIGADVGVRAAREIVAELRAEFHAGTSSIGHSQFGSAQRPCVGG